VKPLFLKSLEGRKRQNLKRDRIKGSSHGLIIVISTYMRDTEVKKCQIFRTMAKLIGRSGKIRLPLNRFHVNDKFVGATGMFFT
jgi:hypothetical protein